MTNAWTPHVTKFVSAKKKDNVGKSMGENVLCIGATSFRYPLYKKKDMVSYETFQSSLPLSIRVPCYSSVEFLAAMKMYLSSGVVEFGASNNELITFRTHVGNNPRLARRDSQRFFLPIHAEHTSRVWYTINTGRAETIPNEIVDDLSYGVEEEEGDLRRCSPKDEEGNLSLTHLTDIQVKHL